MSYRETAPLQSTPLPLTMLLKIPHSFFTPWSDIKDIFMTWHLWKLLLCCSTVIKTSLWCFEYFEIRRANPLYALLLTLKWHLHLKGDSLFKTIFTRPYILYTLYAIVIVPPLHCGSKKQPSWHSSGRDGRKYCTCSACKQTQLDCDFRRFPLLSLSLVTLVET